MDGGVVALPLAAYNQFNFAKTKHTLTPTTMKTTFFAAAIIALLGGSNAVLLSDNMQFEEDCYCECESAGMGNTETDVDEAVKAATLKVTAGECKKEEKVPFETAMLGALNEVSNKSSQLRQALQTQFNKQKELLSFYEQLIENHE